MVATDRLVLGGIIWDVMVDGSPGVALLLEDVLVVVMLVEDASVVMMVVEDVSVVVMVVEHVLPVNTLSGVILSTIWQGMY